MKPSLTASARPFLIQSNLMISMMIDVIVITLKLVAFY
jgi:hypothetical protein